MTQDAPDEKETFVDDRPKQESLIKQPERAEPETRIDRGSSDEFTDDRIEIEESEDTGEQSALTGDYAQKTLSGKPKGPAWY